MTSPYTKLKWNKMKYAKCPACKTEKHKTEMKVAISDMEKLEKAEYKNYKKLKINTFDSFIESDFSWACDFCLKSKKAIKANPSLQNYSWNPNYAYYDTEKICRTCNDKFTFSKEEKKYWYEGLKFRLDSEPVNCFNCRKEVRKYKIENNFLSETLKKNEEEISINELEKVIEIYKDWQKEQRAKYYESLLNKRKKTG